jgi:ankyrin repeat protein
MRSNRTISIGVALLATTWIVTHRPASAAPVAGKLGPELFLAVGKKDLAGVNALLGRGADPNARNFLQMTPLIFAAFTGETGIVERLLAAGAALEAESPFGTSLTFAAMGGSLPVTRQLLARGARPNPRRPDGITILMLAARNGHAEIVKTLLTRVPVDARDNDRATALFYAAREGHAEVVRLLLAKGAAVDAVDSQGWSALVHAGLNGHAECVQLLLSKGANPNRRDKKGRTPLILVATYADRPTVVAALLTGGADPAARDSRNRTALSLAEARGRVESAKLLSEPPVHPAPADSVTPASHGTGSPAKVRTPRQAVEASLPLLQQSMKLFLERTGCASCHHEGLGHMATGLARRRGFPIDGDLAKAQYERIAGMLNSMRPQLQRAVSDPHAALYVPGAEISEGAPMFGFLLSGLAASQQAPNRLLSAAALTLARQQEADGRWDFVLPRVPTQSSAHAMTAMAVQVIRAYAPRDRAEEMAGRIRRAKAWLMRAPAPTTEDKVFRLLGLRWAGASLEERREAITALRAEQRPDGGWAQLPALLSDAYATGTALFALNQAGAIPVSDPTYRRGVDYLLRTQDEDGSWFVAKRAIPANNYFDSGFPHGQSQYMSFSATCWATMALTLAADGPASYAAR